jgi:AcrR family transcriptional regulator
VSRDALGGVAEPGSLDVEARAVAALLACVARQGVRKTTLDDVAREAGCSRATLYRYFASKQVLLDAAVDAEVQRILAALHAAAADADTLEAAIVAVLATAGRELGGHPALTFVAAFEPERLLPHLAFAAGDRILAVGGAAIEPGLARFVDPDRAARAAEWVARVALGLLCAPLSPVALDDEAAVRAYTREFIVPAVVGPTLTAPTPASRR